MSSIATPGVSPGFRRLALTTAIMLYVLINVGGIVRVTRSGLGCPDWPLCHGQVVPLESSDPVPVPESSGIATAIEFSHRVTAGVTGLFMLATMILAWRNYRDNKRLVWFSTLVVIITPLEFILGGIVVLTELEPLLVLIHLGTALIIFACSLVVMVEAYRPDGLPDESLPRNYSRWLWLAIAATFTLVMFGALVVGYGASYACQDWPLCYGQIFPAGQTSTVHLHVTHRYVAAGVGLLLLGLILYTYRRRESMPGMSRLAVWLGVFFLGQIIVGALKIWSQLATILRATHLGMAAAVWAILVIMLILAYFRQQHDNAEDGLAHR